MNEKLLKRFQLRAEMCQQSLDKWAEDFAKDPAHTLSWGTTAFENAARLRVLKQIIAALQDGTANLENIRETMMSRVMHRSKYPPQSTSPTSNLIDQYELAACADILESIRYLD